MRYRNRRLLIAAVSLWMGLTALHAANVVTVNSAEGAPGQQPTIAVALRTDAADVAAAEIRVPLPEGVEPVAGSLTLSSGRVPDHSVTADMNGRDYVIVLFNTSLKAIPAGDGELLSFKVTLGDNPGRFTLSPKVKLSGRRGESIAAETTVGALNVLAPRLELGTTSVDFGRVALRSEAVQYVEVRNSGTTTLTFDSYTTTGVEGLTAVMPRSLAEGESAMIELHYTPTVRSSGIDGRFTPVSDGVGLSQFVRIQAVPFSVNELHVGSATGISDEEVTISVSMNNMEPIIGVELHLPLSDGLQYVDNSLEITSRLTGFLYDCSVDIHNCLHIVIFSIDNHSLTGHLGDILNFRLLVTGDSDSYILAPTKVKLIANDGVDVATQFYFGNIEIRSPEISCARYLDLSEVHIERQSEYSFNIDNIGDAQLIIDRIYIDKDGILCTSNLPISIEPGNSIELKLAFDNPDAGHLDTPMRIYTNDPHNRVVKVDVSAFVYTKNILRIDGSYYHGAHAISGSIINDTPVVALQADFVCPEGCTTENDMVWLSDRAYAHSASLDKIDNNRYRLVIFSLDNTPFAGNDGEVFHISLHGENLSGKSIRIENIRLSNAKGENITPSEAKTSTTVLPDVVFVTKLSIRIDAQVLKVGDVTAAYIEDIQPAGATNMGVDWSTSDLNVINVDNNGVVRAVGAGKAFVIASAADGSGTFAQLEIEVLAIPVERIILSHDEISLEIGEFTYISANIYPEDATDKTVTWVSSNEAIATVDGNGKIIARSIGEVVITANCGSVSATCRITVVPFPAASVTLNRSDLSLKATETFKLEAIVSPATTTDKTVTWTSSNEAVATVDANGNVTAVAVGEATITASCGNVSATCSITVVPTPAESVTLSEHTLDMLEGAVTMLTAVVAPDDATYKDVIWTSSDEGVVTVGQDGTLTAVAEGTATIRVAMADDATVYDECRVTVSKETSGIAEIVAGDAPYEVYDLNGVKVGDSLKNLKPGFYIVRQGGTAKKLRIKN